MPLLLATFCSAYAAAPSDGTPKQVQIVKQDGAYQLLVNDAPYEVKGVGLGGNAQGSLSLLRAVGGNSIRTWSAHNADAVLHNAAANGVMVALGFDTDKELHGFDYNDESAVQAQFERLKQTVQKYKDHPNLLVWVVANEPNLLFNDDGSLKDVNPKVYQAIGKMIDYIHQEDPNHPVTYAFAGAPADHIKTAMQYTPNVDFISLQLYGDVANLPQIIEELNIDKPFMVTEYGAIGHWERPVTEWEREIEEPSGIKAETFSERLHLAFDDNPTGKVIGSFAFLWGQKQERTPTWYGMINADGKPNARVDELTRYWTGEYPSNRAPRAQEITLNDKLPHDNVYATPGQPLTVKVVVSDEDSLRYEWELLKEVAVRSEGGAFEKRPEAVPITVIKQQAGELSFSAPLQEGDYRIYSYSYDGKGKVGNANFPFYVKP
ncbi:glycoside hydrolase family 2 TIM barrel-domain containing protein [Gilvimarinus polysaccharolyticus]|uniref:glycoside hydrolase family 2 TIM barrel-domain containing protein n=1 Tax=Gilvimarinus polysaccharolyticus TaxID=863921 RepID=UPI001E610D26|nr:glycoside hydrolase family 2 TIM barrel-domain containing protein [Gilvimarinus polysaccharolyticus]